MTDLRQTKQYANFMKNTGWQVEKINNNYIYIKSFPIWGKFIKIQRPMSLSEEFIKKIINKHKPFQLIIEPALATNYQLLTTKFGFRQTSPYLPSKTIHISLTKSEKKLMSDISKKSRYAIRYAQKHGVKIKLSEDINEFSQNWHHFRYQKNPLQKLLFSQKRQFQALKKSFGKDLYILNAHYQEKIIATVMLILAEDTAYYFYAAADKTYKKYNAPSLLVWESLVLAKNRGAKIFDFEGIYDERNPLKSWHGFTHFKKSFGGVEVIYPKSFKKVSLKNIIRGN